MKNKKVVLITIIVLLAIFVPLTIVGFVNRPHKDIEKKDENPNHEFFLNGYYWFYDSNDNLLGKYECQDKDCGLAKYSIDDEEYNLDYYKEGTIDTLSYNHESHTIITDGAKTYLYDIKNGNNMLELKMVKTYNTKLEDNMYIVKNNNDLYGIIKLIPDSENSLIVSVPMEYEFIGLNKELNTNKIIAKKDGGWLLIDSVNNPVTNTYADAIVNFNDKYIVTKDINYSIYNYDGVKFYENLIITNYAISTDYIAVISENMVYVYNNDILLNSFNVTNTEGKLTLEVTESTISIKLDDSVVGTINLI